MNHSWDAEALEDERNQRRHQLEDAARELEALRLYIEPHSIAAAQSLTKLFALVEPIADDGSIRTVQCVRCGHAHNCRPIAV